MAFVPGYDHDIFVSYAHLDNEPFAKQQTGFVSQLVDDLEKSVNRKVAEKGFAKIDIWWDHYALRGNSPVTPEIILGASRSACIVIVASPLYLASEWCDKERDTFINALAGRPDASRAAICIVQTDLISQDTLPETLRDMKGFPFFKTLGDKKSTRPLSAERDDDKGDYQDRLVILAQDLSESLKRLKSIKTLGSTSLPASPTFLASSPGKAPEEERSNSEISVLLAEVTDDLVRARESIKNYLTQSGIKVLPEKKYSRDDPKLHKEQLVADMRRSRLCVQLLSPLEGADAEYASGLVRFRYETMHNAGLDIPIVQWRDKVLDIESIEDKEYRKFVSEPRVRQDEFSAFRKTVEDLARRCTPRSPPEGDTRSRKSVFVHAGEQDRQVETIVRTWLAKQDIMVLKVPEHSPDPRDDWEDLVKQCDSVLLIYGNSNPKWVRQQITQTNKVRCNTPVGLLGVCVTPPPLPSPYIPSPPDYKINAIGVDGRFIYFLHSENSDSVDESELRKFAERLRGV